ncbi:MAG: amino acid permease [Chthoniobacterales bacterium]
MTPENSGSSRKTISLLTASALVIANMVGTGIFTMLGFQLVDIHSGFSILLLWATGGVVALCGALSYGELISRLPRSGGEYNFLSRIYHPAIGFMAGWIGLTAGFCTPIALSCIAFGKYFSGALDFAHPLLLSIIIVICISGVHLLGVGVGAVFQNAFTALKLVILLTVSIAAFVWGSQQNIVFLPHSTDIPTIISPPFAIALMYVMYAYSGWNAAVYIAGEVRNPRINVPVALIIGTLIVIGCYLLLNTAFLYSTPQDAMRGQVEVGLIAGRHIFGLVGGNIVGGFIAMALISGISAMIWMGSRVAMTIGEDFTVLRFLARKDESGTPIVAILAQMTLIVIILCIAKFEDILVYTEFSLMSCLFLSVLGVFVLRRRFGRNEGGIEAWGYPITPALFLIVEGFIFVHLFIERPTQSLIGVAGMALGLILYFCEPRANRRVLASRIREA